MQKLFTLLTAILFLHFSSSAQLQISGHVNDGSEKKSIQNAVIALLTPKDSVLYKFTRSDAEGKFIFKDVKP